MQQKMGKIPLMDVMGENDDFFTNSCNSNDPYSSYRTLYSEPAGGCTY